MQANLSSLPDVDELRRALMDPQFFAERFLDVRLHAGQTRWLENSTESENILVTGNRWGKSFVSAVKLVQHALFRPRNLKYDHNNRYRAVIASITQDQANLTFNQVVRFIRQSSLLQMMVTSITRTPYPQILFGNDATIESRTTQNRGEYLLGNDYDLFIFDEVAFETEPEYVVEDVIMMRLADREGKLDLVSTPNGKNWFYRRAREIQTGKRKGYFQPGDSRDNMYISAEYLKERVEYFSESRLKQNIMGEFVDSGGEILKGEYVDRALTGENDYSFKVDNESPLLISGWDLARKRTATVGITIQLVEGVARIVALERFRHFDWNVVLERIRARQREYPGRLIIDGTGLGDVIQQALSEYKPEAVIFTAASKAELLSNVELFHAKGTIKYDRWALPDGEGKTWSLEDELREARWDDNNKCDGLMALALSLWPLRKQRQVEITPRVGKA